MNNAFAPGSRFMELAGRFAQLVRLNLLWLLCCIPILTAGASTTALCACIYELRRGEDPGAKAFFRYFRLHFKRATVLWLVTLFFAAVLAVDYYIAAYSQFPGRMAVIGLIFFAGFLLMFFSGICYPLLSQFPDTVKNTVVNAVLLSIAKLPKLLLVTAANLLPVMLLLALPKVFVFTGAFWIVCGFSLIAYYDAFVLEKVFEPFREK